MKIDNAGVIFDRLTKVAGIITTIWGLIAIPISIVTWDGAAFAVWLILSAIPVSIYLFLLWLLTGKIIQTNRSSE